MGRSFVTTRRVVTFQQVDVVPKDPAMLMPIGRKGQIREKSVIINSSEAV